MSDDLRATVLQILDEHLASDEAADAEAQRQLGEARATIATLEGTVADLRAQLAKLTAPIWRTPGAKAVGQGVYPVPDGFSAMPVVPDGKSVKAAIAAAVKAGTKRLALVAAPGSYSETWSTPASLAVVFLPAGATALDASAQVWLDGKGTTKRHVTASGPMLFRGVGTRGHVPPFGTADGGNAENSENVAFYLGGNDAGSGFEDCQLTDCTGNLFKILADKAVVRRCTLTTVGHTGGYLAGAHDAVVEDVLVDGYNLRGYDAEPETAALKITRSSGVKVRNLQIRDGNGGHALWFDDTCWDCTVVHLVVDGKGVAGRKAIKDGFLAELSEAITVVDMAAPGCSTSAVVLDSGHVRFWGCDFRGVTSIGVKVYQDRRRSGGKFAPKSEVPWFTTGIEFANCDFPAITTPLVAYCTDDPAKTPGEAMIARLAGCTMPKPPKISDKSNPTSTTATRTPDALRSLLGDRVQALSTDTDVTKAARVPVPDDVAALVKGVTA